MLSQSKPPEYTRGKFPPRMLAIDNSKKIVREDTAVEFDDFKFGNLKSTRENKNLDNSYSILSPKKNPQEIQAIHYLQSLDDQENFWEEQQPEEQLGEIPINNIQQDIISPKSPLKTYQKQYQKDHMPQKLDTEPAYSSVINRLYPTKKKPKNLYIKKIEIENLADNEYVPYDKIQKQESPKTKSHSTNSPHSKTFIPNLEIGQLTSKQMPRQTTPMTITSYHMTDRMRSSPEERLERDKEKIVKQKVNLLMQNNTSAANMNPLSQNVKNSSSPRALYQNIEYLTINKHDYNVSQRRESLKQIFKDKTQTSYRDSIATQDSKQLSRKPTVVLAVNRENSQKILTDIQDKYQKSTKMQIMRGKKQSQRSTPVSFSIRPNNSQVFNDKTLRNNQSLENLVVDSRPQRNRNKVKLRNGAQEATLLQISHKRSNSKNQVDHLSSQKLDSFDIEKTLKKSATTKNLTSLTSQNNNILGQQGLQGSTKILQREKSRNGTRRIIIDTDNTTKRTGYSNTLNSPTQEFPTEITTIDSATTINQQKQFSPEKYMIKKPSRPKGGQTYGKIKSTTSHADKLKQEKPQLRIGDPNLIKHSLGVQQLDSEQVNSLRYYWESRTTRVKSHARTSSLSNLLNQNLKALMEKEQQFIPQEPIQVGQNQRYFDVQMLQKKYSINSNEKMVAPKNPQEKERNRVKIA